MSTMTRTDSARNVMLMVAGARIDADLVVPDEAIGLVVMAYPTAGSRRNSTHRRVAEILNEEGLATVVCDLLTDDEALLDDLRGEFRRDVPLLETRLAAIIGWCEKQPDLRDLAIGLLGVGTAAAAAIRCAARRSTSIHAVVVRGGRLDLAWHALGHLHAPVLLIAGEHDTALRDVYRLYLPYIGAFNKDVAIVPGAGGLFSEPRALDAFAERAAGWFTEHLDRRDLPAGWTAEIC
ncbi:MAG TPA: hypothetical protein VFT29_00885 [Gemmatimonadaceae bacterium]|nr:hypothetical protein [Gemmatimonadaceae bacterium]